MSRYIDAEKIRYIHRPQTQDDIAYKDEIDKIPTADVAPVVHAHWIDKEENIYGFPPNILRVCSNCDTEYESTFMAACCAFIPSDAFGAGDDTKFPKCPCCGARMDEEEEK